jgi:CDP-diacylglycerol---glycerol-3-phosphate 3-phosphatidyltransferase
VRIKLNLPNILSLFRIIISPVIFFMIISEDSFLVKLGCVLFFVGSMTDYVDGWVARKYKIESNMGKFIDPLADKFLTSGVFLAFVVLKILSLWMVLIIIIRDILNTFLRLYADSKNKPITTTYSAKVKTTLQMLFLSYLLTLLYLKYLSYQFIPVNDINLLIYSSSTYMAMLILTVITVWTFLQYINKNLHIISLLFGVNEKFLRKIIDTITYPFWGRPNS